MTEAPEPEDKLDVATNVVVNGPEDATLDWRQIVIASETAVFQDAPHMALGLVPGDGVHVVWTHLLGPNRGRYFLLTGQELNANEAWALGVVSEILSPDRLLERAHELARMLLARSQLARRHSRLLLTRRLKALMHDDLDLGLALEGLSAIEHWPTNPPDPA